MTVNFLIQKSGLTINLTDLSTEVPSDATYAWDFGDDNTSTEKAPSHTYSKSGFYSITLTVNSNTSNISTTLTCVVSDKVYTTLSDTIYNLIETHLPDNLVSYITIKDKRVYIEKWQLYLQPIVNHDIPILEYNNELYYEALENELIMELAAYDWLNIGIMNLLQALTKIVTEKTSSGNTVTSTTSGGIKKIVTGPTEVDYYEDTLDGEAAYNIVETITGALKTGGTIENLKANICMLAERLDIFLPICQLQTIPIPPKVVNKRH